MNHSLDNTSQSAFAEAILHPAGPVPQGVTGPGGAPARLRFAVYRNNVVAGLGEALKAAYPVVSRIVGEPFFSAMARIYVLRNPPASPVMLEYGASFADFIAMFEPAAVLPYLADVARLERAWVEAYHAADATPLDPSLLGAITADLLPRIGFTLHPSARLVRSAFPVLSIWETNIEGVAPTPIDAGRAGENAFVVRAGSDVAMHRLSRGAAAFIDAILLGNPVSAAASSALIDEPGFDLADALRGLLAAGAVVGWFVAEPPAEATQALPSR